MLVSPGVIVLAYLIGSVPWSFLVARAFGVADVRNVGSGNVGATSAQRIAEAGLAELLDLAPNEDGSILRARRQGGELYGATRVPIETRGWWPGRPSRRGAPVRRAADMPCMLPVSVVCGVL